MQFSIEKKISNFVESQFPQFYLDEGPNFVLFVKAYYEWLESQGSPIGEARNIFDYRDIDNTLDDFLSHFQQKYLYGIPFKTIANPRFLLKHILDVYRSKGSIQCYKLLFRLIYDQDIDVYLPGEDILKASDGTWIQPQYLEVTNVPLAQSLVGKNILGVSSGTTAVVESYIVEPIASNEIVTLYISNILPRGGTFNEGEKIVEVGQQSNTAYIQNAPSIRGSLNELTILNGGQAFNVGDILKIAHRDIVTNGITSYGVDGLLRVTNTSSAQGSLNFDIQNGGFGFNSNALVFIYNGTGDITGSGGSFNLGGFSYVQNVIYNTDIISDYVNTSINALAYGFPGDTDANSADPISDFFSYANQNFGTLASLTNISTGNGYTQQPYIFIRNIESTNQHFTNVAYSTSSNTITGTSTYFTDLFQANDVIYMQANSSGSSLEYQIIKSVNSDTSITLYGPPKFTGNIASGAFVKTAPTIMPSNFAVYEPLMSRTDGTIDGLNATVLASPSSGSGVVSKAVAINSGKGYQDGEIVKAYLYGGLTTPGIINGGTNYSNNDVLIFQGGGTNAPASGYVTTNTTGGITSVILNYSGSGYIDVPAVRVNSKTGSGAVLYTTITDLNTYSAVSGKVQKAGVGKKQGYWSTSRGFLNSDKYIQDSYFYQDFSYQIKVAQTLDSYKDILYNTFHTSGAELFGQYAAIIDESSPISILYEQSSASLS